MKGLIRVCASALLLSVAVAAEEGLVYLTGYSPNTSPSSLTTPEARLLFAQRLGLSRYHSLKDASENTLDAINAFGSRSQSIFTAQQSVRRRQAFAIIEGVVEPQGIFGDIEAPHLTLRQPPSLSQDEQLTSDIIQQLDDDRISHIETPSMEDLTLWAAAESAKYEGKDFILHETDLAVTAKEHGVKSNEYREKLQRLRQHLESVSFSPKDADYDLTIVLMPLQADSKGILKRSSSSSSWGPYSRIKRQEPVESGPEKASGGRLDYTPESEEFSHIDTHGERPVDAPEGKEEGAEDEDTAPASPPEDGEPPAPPPTRPPPMAADDPEAEDKEITNQQSPASPKPVRGIIPSCYTTATACETATHNCSAHGTCTKKYTDPSRSETCYSCSCSVSREDRSSGRVKTIQWAGPACQKKDVSMPFWLLGSTTVGILSAVAAAIGMLYSMGSQELPSVIGAGVSSPGARAK